VLEAAAAEAEVAKVAEGPVFVVPASPAAEELSDAPVDDEEGVTATGVGTSVVRVVEPDTDVKVEVDSVELAAVEVTVVDVVKAVADEVDVDVTDAVVVTPRALFAALWTALCCVCKLLSSELRLLPALPVAVAASAETDAIDALA
jgi:hypothetical protein